MSKNTKNLNPHEKEIVLTALYESAQKFNGTDAVKDFIDNLLTESEKITLGRRILISQMILSGCSQMEIRSKLNVSPNTFTRTRKWLGGQIPQYDQALKEYQQLESTKQKKSSRKEKENYNPFTFRGIRKKYPMHFLFFDVADTLLGRLTENKS